MKVEQIKNTSLFTVTMTKAELERYKEFTGHENTVQSLRTQMTIQQKQSESLAEQVIALDKLSPFDSDSALGAVWSKAVSIAKDILS